MQNKVNLEQILKQYLTLEAVRKNNPDYTFNMILSAMKEACRQALELAAENADLDFDPKLLHIVDKQSILDTIKQVE